MNKPPPSPPPPATQQDDWVEVVRQKVAGLRFGVVQIVVHDSRVVEIDRTERIRFETVHRNQHHARPPQEARPRADNEMACVRAAEGAQGCKKCPIDA